MSHHTIQSETQRPQSPQWCAGRAVDAHRRVAERSGRRLLLKPQRLVMHRADVRGLVDAVVQAFGIRARLTSDAEIRDAAIGLTDTELDELREYPGLLIVEVGLLAHRNRQAAGALEEVVSSRPNWSSRPTWVVSDPALPWTSRSHSYSDRIDRVLHQLGKYQTYDEPIPAMAASTPHPVPSWPCADWTPTADQRGLLRAEQDLQDQLYMRDRDRDEEEDEFDPWVIDEETGRHVLATRRRRARPLPPLPTDAAPRSLLESVYRASMHLLHAMGEERAEGAARKLRDLEAFATVAGRSLQALAGEYVSPHHCDSYDALVWRAWLRADPRFKEWKRAEDKSRRDSDEHRASERARKARPENKRQRKANAAVENARKSVRDWSAKHAAAPTEQTKVKLLETYARLVRALQPQLPEDEVMSEARRMMEGAR